MTIPDFSKRLTTAWGRVEANDPGPGSRTSIGPSEREAMIEAQKKSLTTEVEDATIPKSSAPEPERSEPAASGSDDGKRSGSEPGNDTVAVPTP
jgi:hypothetical protein